MVEIEGYSDLEIIGRGGFAVVYKAQQISVGRDVAIKLLIDPSPDDDLVRRFRRESKAVGALSWHPHIAAVVDAGATATGQAYIVFELLSGGSLDDRIANNAMPWNEAISAMVQVADAVEAAHRADVLHRDIKPANILLDRLGVAKLGDFGIASMQDGTKTETGMLATTVAHAAPELFDGQPSSAATDIYALGSTLHTLLTGAPPFAPLSGERVATTIAKILNQPPPRPDSAVVPERVSTVIAHALAKQPQYRPRSAAAFGHALQQVQRELGQPVTAMPVSDNEPAPQLTGAPHEVPQNPSHPSDQIPANPPYSSDQIPANPPYSSDQIPASPPYSSDQIPANPPYQSDQFAPSYLQNSQRTDLAPSKPFGRTIIVLSAIALLLAIGVGGLFLVQNRSGTGDARVTSGGAEVVKAVAPSQSTLTAFPTLSAFDQDPTTFWGIAPNPQTSSVLLTTLRIELADVEQITRVGVMSGDSNQLGRVAQVWWATSIEELNNNAASVVVQDVADQPGAQTVAFPVETDMIVIAIGQVHDNEANAIGIADILIEVADG